MIPPFCICSFREIFPAIGKLFKEKHYYALFTFFKGWDSLFAVPGIIFEIAALGSLFKNEAILANFRLISTLYHYYKLRTPKFLRANFFTAKISNLSFQTFCNSQSSISGWPGETKTLSDEEKNGSWSFEKKFKFTDIDCPSSVDVSLSAKFISGK